MESKIKISQLDRFGVVNMLKTTPLAVEITMGRGFPLDASAVFEFSEEFVRFCSTLLGVDKKELVIDTFKNGENFCHMLVMIDVNKHRANTHGKD